MTNNFTAPSPRSPPVPLSPLRGSAEARLARTPPESTELPVRSAEELLHELQVHHLELEMQNETLRKAQINLERSRDRYLDLYSFAPVGYMTLNNACQITEINFTGASLLGVERSRLFNRLPDFFVVAADRERWKSCILAALKRDQTQPFDVTLERQDGSLCDVRVDCRRATSDNAKPSLLVTLTDVTERKKVEAALRESEERLNFALTATQDAVWDYDLASGMLKHNPRWSSLLGISDGLLEHRAELFFDKIHPDDKEAVHRWITACCRDDDSHRIEYRLRQSDGQYLRIADTGRVVKRRPGGQALRIVGAFSDISQRRQAEATSTFLGEALRQSRQPMLLADPDARITYLNPAFTALFGYRLRDLLGVPVTHMTAPRGVLLPDQGASERRAPATDAGSGTAEHLAWDGTLLPVAANVGTIRDEQGQLLGFVGSYTGQGLQGGEKSAGSLKFSLAVEQCVESIVITGTDSVIEYVNEAFVRKTGYSKAEAIGKTPRNLQSGKTPRATYNSLAKALANGHSWKGEFCNRRKDGSEHIEYARITPIRAADGRITHYLAAEEDLSEERCKGAEFAQYSKDSEDSIRIALRSKEQGLERDADDVANCAKNAFLANMSHEIRTPMNAMLGSVYLMRTDGVTGRQGKHLDRIDTAGKHLLNILNDMLDLAEMQAGGVVLEEADIFMPDLMSNITAIIAPQVSSKGLQLIIDSPPLAWHVQGDATRISQALLNLANNAVKFTATGAVTLRVRLLDETADSKHLRFEVADTGIGIAPDQLERLFSPFVQADSSSTREYGGTGLGLSITRFLAHLMGGDAGASSALGVGSTFWFTARLKTVRLAPAALQDAQEQEEDAAMILARDYGQKRLLLVEDDIVSQWVATELLGNASLQVCTAGDGRQALAALRQVSYDLILMDIQRPTMDGVDTAREIRKIPGYASVPIVAMTAPAFGTDQEECLAAGINDFLTKPLLPSVFYALLLKWFRHADQGKE
jgi:PAS domain S-box-containing protein